MKKVLLLACLSFFVTLAYGQATKIGYLSFVTGGSGSTGQPANNLNPQDNPIEANYKTDGLTTMTISRGGGMSYINNSTYSYASFLPANQDEAAAIENNVYYQLEVKSAANYLNFNSLKSRLRTANETVAAGITYRWQYSLNGTDYTPIGSSVLLGFTNTNGDEQTDIDLSGINELKVIAPNTSVYFRIYAWGANGGTNTQRGFGFGKSSATTTELITLKGFVTDAPYSSLMASWDLTGVNANNEPTYTVVASAFQQSWVRKTDVVNTIEVARGNGLSIGSLANAFAVIYNEGAIGTIPTSLAEAKTKETYYGVELIGDATNYIQILGYRMKLRGATTTARTARWSLLIGDDDNNISSNSPVVDLGSADVTLSTSAQADGLYYSLVLDNNDISAVIPPNKKAELRLYLWGGTSTSTVFGLGRLADETHLQIYGKTLTAAEYLQVLPVTLTSFNATKQSNSVRLNWTTVSEKDNSHFNVLRAGDDKNFVSIGKVNGSGTISTAKEYSLTDYKPLGGANYYKLTQTDLDGKTSEVGDVKYVQFDLNTTSLTVLSGVETSTVKAILNANKADKATVVIYNVSGNSVYKASLNVVSGINEVSAPVNLNKGAYILKITTKNGEAWQTKFVR